MNSSSKKREIKNTEQNMNVKNFVVVVEKDLKKLFLSKLLSKSKSESVSSTETQFSELYIF